MNTRLLSILLVLVSLCPLQLLSQTADNFDTSPAWSAVPQLDGCWVLGGSFTKLSGESHVRIGRVDANGVPDSNFNPSSNGAWPDTLALALQLDGRIVVGGGFTDLNGTARNSLGRLAADGTLDSSFNPSPVPPEQISQLAVMPDGDILAAGDFRQIGGAACTNLARLLPSGAADPSFTLRSIGPVGSFSFQDDGKIIVSGAFTNLQGVAGTNVTRLNADGSVDTAFHAATPSLAVCSAVQADGKILLGGYWNLFVPSGGGCLGRLNTDGTPDTGFHPVIKPSYAYVYALAVQADGKIIVGGAFTNLAGYACTNLGRLTASGAFDPTFNPGTDGVVEGLVLQNDGKVMATGYFTSIGGQVRNHIGRLNNPDAATESLTVHASRAVWLRGGASPEIWAATFESSPDGTHWTNIGGGQRIAGGWRSTNSVPTGYQVRARGYALASNYRISSYLVGSATTTTNLELVANGSFEFGSYTADAGAHWMSLFVGATNILGWTVGETDSAGVDWHDPHQFGSPQDGSFCLDLNTAGVIEQSVAVPHPGSYEVSFYWIAPTDMSGGVRSWSNATVRVEFGGASADFSRETHDFEESTNQWQRAAFVVSVTSNTNLLRFTSIYGGGFWGPVIDDVAIRESGIQVSQPLPAIRSAFAGSTATFSASATSALSPLALRWQKNGVDLADDARISGSATSTLTITNLSLSDSGSYRLRAWNDAMETNSPVASLWVVDNISFADPNLEQAVRDALGIPTAPLTPADVASLTVLDASYRSITNLSGIESLANLTSLNLSGNPALTGFSSLASLQSLANLAVNDAGLENLSWVTGLQSLSSFQVNANFIQDLSPLIALSNLVSFSITENQLTVIDPLLELPLLTGEINLGWNRLNTNATSAAWAVITNLTARGAVVNFDPQLAAPVPPVITRQPVQVVAFPGDTVDFSVEASGSDLLWKWKKNGVALFDSTHMTGTDANTLTINSVTAADAGDYSVRVWNDHGIALSTAATLRVVTNVAFADPNLEQAVRDHLGIPTAPLTPANLASLTDLDAASYGITNLSGIENLANLTSLSLRDNQGIADLTPLTELAHLTYLELNECGVSNIGFVAAMPLLAELHLSSSTIADILPLAGQTNLIRLNLSHSPGITNFSVLTNLSLLQELWLEDSGLTNIAFVEAMPSLEILTIANNSVQDMTPLASATHLWWLDVGANPATNTSPLGAMTSLREFHAGNLGLGTSNAMTFLATLTNLVAASLEDNQITSLPAYPSLQKLQRLNLNHNPLANLAFVRNLTNLADLNIDGTGSANLAPLAGMTNLLALGLAGNHLSDIAPLATLTHLQWITFWDNNLQNISALAGLTNLTYVDLRWNLLNISSGSAALGVIQTLQSRSTFVDYLEQKIWLTNPARTGGGFLFTIQSTPGAVLNIQLSTTLTNWISLGILTNATGATNFTDAGSDEACFYRVLKN